MAPVPAPETVTSEPKAPGHAWAEGISPEMEHGRVMPVLPSPARDQFDEFDGLGTTLKTMNRRCKIVIGTTLTTYMLWVSIGTPIIGLVSFSAFPVSNPLHEKGEEGWWHCPLACSVCWVPISVSYITSLLQDHVIEPFQLPQLRVMDFFGMCFVAAATLGGSLLLLNMLMQPFPFAAFVAAPLAFVALASFIGCVIIPRLRSHIHAEDKKIITRKLIFVLTFFVWSTVQLFLFLVLAAAVTRAEGLVMQLLAAMGIAALKFIWVPISRSWAELICTEGGIIGQNLALVSAGIVVCIVSGNSGSMSFILVFIASDVFMLVVNLMSITLTDIAGFPIGWVLRNATLLLSRLWKRQPLWEEVEPEIMDHKLRVSLSFIIAAEAGEVIVPLSYIMCWISVRLGRNHGSFSGVGTSEFGLDSVDDVTAVVRPLILLFVVEALSLAVMQVLLFRLHQINLLDESRKLLQEHGTILVIQAVWTIWTTFCCTMIWCGIDYSFQFDYLP